MLIDETMTEMPNIIKPDEICKVNGTYMVGNDESCQLYYLCDEGIASTEKCPEKQLFNLEINECEEESKVFCDKRPKPTTQAPKPTEPTNKCK